MDKSMIGSTKNHNLFFECKKVCKFEKKLKGSTLSHGIEQKTA